MPHLDDRVSILERAQATYDATVRLHADMLAEHRTILARLADVAEQHEEGMAALRQMQTTLATTLAAIKDLLDRPNGH